MELPGLEDVVITLAAIHDIELPESTVLSINVGTQAIHLSIRGVLVASLVDEQASVISLGAGLRGVVFGHALLRDVERLTRELIASRGEMH